MAPHNISPTNRWAARPPIAVRRISLGRAAWVSCDFVEGDSVAEAVELLDEVVASAVGFVAAGEVVAAPNASSLARSERQPVPTAA